MSILNLSLAQIDIVLGDPERNFQQVADMAQEAARRGSQLLLLPELWSTGYALEHAAELSSPMGEGMFARISKLSESLNIAIAGSLLEGIAGLIYNTFTCYGPDGNLLASYRKLHLFRLMEEHLWLSPGDKLVDFAAPWGPSAAAICYDLRFPEMFRHYALHGCQIFLIPAEWPAPRIEHWRTLLKARAIENQAFAAGANRVGKSRGEQFGGHSAVIDPFGTALIEADEKTDLLTISLNLDDVASARTEIPILNDRREDVYGCR